MQIRGSAAVAAHYISGGDFLRDLVCYFPYAWIGYGVPESEQFNTYWRLLPLARLLRAVRDESHAVALGAQRQRRRTSLFREMLSARDDEQSGAAG